MDTIPPDLFLAGFSDAIRDLADALRMVVRRAEPEAIERVRPGWRLIGYDVRVGARTRYFAYVAPEPEHVHLGFEHGIDLADADGLLLGAELGLRQVRYTTHRPGDALPTESLERYVRDAAELARVR